MAPRGWTRLRPRTRARGARACARRSRGAVRPARRAMGAAAAAARRARRGRRRCTSHCGTARGTRRARCSMQARTPPPLPFHRTNRTSLVPPLVLSGQALLDAGADARGGPAGPAGPPALETLLRAAPRSWSHSGAAAGMDPRVARRRNGSKGVEAEALAARLAAALSEMAPRASPGAAGAGAGAGVRAPWGEAEDLARLLSLALARG